MIGFFTDHLTLTNERTSGTVQVSNLLEPEFFGRS